MNKKFIAVALAGAFALPLAAQAESCDGCGVTIYGKIHTSVDYLDDGINKEWNVSDNSSRIGFKGTEDLGNGLSAIWQVESGFRTDNQSGSWASRNSFVGLSGKSWGTFLVGNHDTPVKLLGRSVDLFGDQIGDSRNIISSGTTSSSNNWDLRPKNVMAYLTPNWSGFSGALAYVTNTDADATDPDSIAALSLLAKYANGPMMVGLGYERHDLRGALSNGTSDPYIWRLAGSYKFGEASKVTALYQKSFANGGLDNNDRNAWGLGFAQGFGNNTVKIQYYNAGDLSSTSNTGASMWALGLDHKLSKRTKVYAAYARTNNDDNSSFTAFGAGHGDKPSIAQDTNPAGISFGVMHSF